MAVLIREESFDNISYEILEEATGKSKGYYLSGIFMQTESVNKNGRIYPKHILEKELQRYEKIIKESKAGVLGELGHPDTPSINLHLASHKITDLRFEGNNIVGKAKLLDTPNGKIAKNLIDEGIVLGMSSRGLGSIKQTNEGNIVQDDFRLATVDIVAEPSAHSAWVNGIIEGKEWLLIDGIWTEQDMDHSKKVLKEASKTDLEQVMLGLFSNFLKKLK